MHVNAEMIQMSDLDKNGKPPKPIKKHKIKCKHCGRKFLIRGIRKHQNSCVKKPQRHRFSDA